jgi:molybdenum cofactor guanylyltransferase
MWAIVLAGGASRRMGRPKQDLPLGGRSLLESVVAAARAAAAEVVLVGDRDAAARLGVRGEDDRIAGAGPLSGLAGGLAACPPGVHALLACDLPFVDAAVLRALRDLAAGAQAVVPLIDGRRHPLCALYDRSCLAAARDCLDAGLRRMDDLLARVRVRAVGPEELPGADLGRAVLNVNTPEDYARALRLLEDRG